MGKQILGVTGVRSNSGSLVDVVAPGWNIATLGKGNRVVTATGTSFAAPLVTGVAGMLLTFDDSIPVDSLKTLIVSGAVNGGRSVTDPLTAARPLPILNAYESLKLAARRSGAPLCGNRMWKNGNDIIVDRGNLLETVASLEPRDWQSSFLSAYHGGRRFDMDFGREFDWKPATRTFEEVPYTNLGYGANGGTFLSYDGDNHDNTAYVRANTTNADSSMLLARAQLFSVQTNSELGSATAPPIPLIPPVTVCEVRDIHTHGCLSAGPGGDWTQLDRGNTVAGQRIMMAVDASDSTRGFAAVNIHAYHAEHGDWVPCLFNNDGTTDFECAPPHVSYHSAFVTVYRVDFRAGTWTPVVMDSTGNASRQDAEIEWLGVSETGKEIIWGIGHTTAAADYGPITCTNQAIEFVSLGSPSAPAGTINFRVPLPDGKVCSGEYEAGATIAPSRAFSAPGLMTRAPAPAEPMPQRTKRQRTRVPTSRP